MKRPFDFIVAASQAGTGRVERTRLADETRYAVYRELASSPAALSAPLGFERRHIVEICQRPLSIAEIANSLGIAVRTVRRDWEKARLMLSVALQP